jgi:hypothetical protein
MMVSLGFFQRAPEIPQRGIRIFRQHSACEKRQCRVRFLELARAAAKRSNVLSDHGKIAAR